MSNPTITLGTTPLATVFEPADGRVIAFDGNPGDPLPPNVGDDLFICAQVFGLGTTTFAPLANPVTFSISDTGSHTWDIVYQSDNFSLWHTKVVTTPLTVTFVMATTPPLGGPYTELWYAFGAVAVGGANSFDVHFGGGNGTSTAGAIAVPSAIKGQPLPVNITFSSTAIDWTGVFIAFRGDTQDLFLGFLGSDTYLSSTLPPSIPSFSGGGTETDFLGGSWFAALSNNMGFVSYTFASIGGGSCNDVVADICKRAGLDCSQIDTSLLNNANIFGGSTIVTGYLCERATSAEQLLKPLMQAYFFDACETGGKLKFVPRGLASVLTIPEADLGLLSDGAKVKPEQIVQEQDLPLSARVMFNDPALDYQQGFQERTRSTRVKSTKQQTILSFPIVMSVSQALQIAETYLYLAWLEGNGYTFHLASAQYMRLDATDVIQFVYEGLTFQIRIVDNSIGQGFAVEVNGVNEDARNFLSSLSAPGNPSFNPSGPKAISSSALFLFDIPLLLDTDANPGGTGFYFAFGSSVKGWSGAVLYSSSDDSNFAAGPGSSENVTYGSTTTALGAPRSPWELDTVNTLTIQLAQGSLTGDTLLNVLNGSNALIVASGSGFEIIQFENAVQNMDGTYTISNLLRGRRGTEAFCGSHAIGDPVLVPATGIDRVQKNLAVLAQPLYYRGVTVGQDPSTADTQQFTIAGQDLKPYAPAGVGGFVDASGNIAITWARRTRIGGEADWADGVSQVPLSEDSESYDVDILNGSTVVRTITGLTTPAAIYTSAMQTADFGSTQASVNVNVYQRSAQVGRGSKASGTAPSSWPPPWPVVLPGGQLFYVNGS